MNFKQLKDKFKDFLIIDSQSINLAYKPKYLRRQISEWKKKKWLIELRRGMYVINDVYFTEKISPLYIANKIYNPSYVSLEYALYEYEIIPETVNAMTSVTSRKTAKFENKFGRFNYSKIKNNLFFGYKIITHNRQNIFYATKEKALLDFIYINIKLFKETFDDFYNCRFQNLNNLHWNKLNKYLRIFNNKKLTRIINLLKEFMKKEKYKEL